MSVLLMLMSRTGLRESLLPSSVSGESNCPSASPPELPPFPAEHTFPFKLEEKYSGSSGCSLAIFLF